MERFGLFFWFCVRLMSLLSAQAAPLLPSVPTPSLQEIIDHTLARDDARQKELQTMQYDQAALLEELDDSGAVLRRENLCMLIRPGASPSMAILSLRGDQIPSNPDEAEAQAKGRDVEDNKQNFTLRKLVNRFTLTLEGEDKLAGQRAYVVAFAPKPDQPSSDETEKVVNQLHGRMWIDAKTYDVLQTEASLAQPISIAWFLATIPKLDFHYRLLDPTNSFSSSQVQITLQVRAPLVGFHERQTIDMTDFRPRVTGIQPVLARPDAPKTFYDATLGWVYTDPKQFPNLYSYQTKSWLVYKQEPGQARTFYFYDTKQWVTD